MGVQTRLVVLAFCHIVRVFLGEQPVVQPDLGFGGMGGGDPVDDAFDLASFRLLAQGRGIVRASQFHHLTGLRVLDDLSALDHIGVPQTDLGPRRQAVELLRRVLAEIVAFDVDHARRTGTFRVPAAGSSGLLTACSSSTRSSG